MVELLIVVLIIGVLASVSVPLYLHYTVEAQLVEGKAIVGVVLTALASCVQSRPAGQECAVRDIAGRIGLAPDGRTGDGRWQVLPDSQLTVGPGVAGAPVLNGAVVAIGRAKATERLAVGLYATPTGTVLRCATTPGRPPGGPTEGEPC